MFTNLLTKSQQNKLHRWPNHSNTTILSPSRENNLICWYFPHPAYLFFLLQ